MAVRYIVALIFFCSTSTLAELAKDIFSCKKNSPDYEECMKRSLSKLVTHFKNGDEDLNIRPLEPLSFLPFEVDQQTGPIPIFLKLTDIDIHGLSDAKISSVKNEENKMVVSFTVKRFIQKGFHRIHGKVFSQSIYGSGYFNITWENTQFTFNPEYKEVVKDGVKYYQIEKMQNQFETDNIIYYFGNLFAGDWIKQKAMNIFLTENWQKSVTIFRKGIENYLETGFVEYFNLILSKIPAKKINGE